MYSLRSPVCTFLQYLFCCFSSCVAVNHPTNQTVKDGVAHSKIPKSARITWPLTLTLTLRTPWMQAYLETIIVCKFGRDRAICLREEAICAKVYRQTDRRRTPRHCISSFLGAWNELKNRRGSWGNEIYLKRKTFHNDCQCKFCIMNVTKL